MSNKKLVRILFAILILVEILTIHLINSKVYAGVIDTWLFSIAILLQLFFFMFIKEAGYRKVFITNTVLLVLIPFLFIFTLPSTTYEDGKVIVQNDIPNAEVIFMTTEYKLIPTTDISSWFIKDYLYHYEVEVSG